ncbi:sugar ABC transporter permease [Fictibacillus sp. KIGAM418]|uniref:Sugar ABC transporter permease n=1 Tax=Fictibacillus marinisediminis TaxID=2878389 RepID=A0A9X1XCV3_9BACL|nr:sugar ABC transporter permease [Fictibacillus marinisediminis]MCK6256695.1 sugar ABC transporter permease [Fictibacillus marinisediminis]
MEALANQSNHRKTSALLSIIPGIGQVYNKQRIKGALFLILAASYFVVFGNLLNMGLWGFFTLGTELPRDHSIILLVQGVIAFIVIGFGIAFYVFNIYDAFQNGKKRDQGFAVTTIKEQYQNVIDKGFPYLLVGPGFFILIFVVVFPILFMVFLAFTNYDLYHSPPAKLVDWVGVQNFSDMFTMDIWRNTFVSVFAWTIIWTFTATTLQVAVGIFLAVVINQKDLKFKGIIRTLLILPWAVPAFVSILVFSGMFNDSFGAINNDILAAFGIDPIPWLTDPQWTKVAIIFIQTWLGFPFIMAMTTGVLQSIPEELYEAATVDGATVWDKFRSITLPMILAATAPIIITQYTFNFNNFNVIYLFNEGGPAVAGQSAGGTDILISWIYNLTMTSAQYSKAAAVTVLLSVVIVTVALINFKRTKAFKDEGMM